MYFGLNFRVYSFFDGYVVYFFCFLEIGNCLQMIVSMKMGCQFYKCKEMYFVNNLNQQEMNFFLDFLEGSVFVDSQFVVC